MKQITKGLKRELYFPTVIYQSVLEDADKLNAKLLDLTYAERTKDESGVQKSNYRKLGGWHSHTSLHKSSDYADLTKKINSILSEVSVDQGYDTTRTLKIGSMWSIINGPGSSNRAHIHPGSYWSGVYYIQAPEGSGDIEFVDPRTVNMMNQPKFIPDQARPKHCWTKVQFKPVPGKMLIFPSWLYHAVHPNLSEGSDNDGNRIIISFNISQKKS